jgi:hypothetical protein
LRQWGEHLRDLKREAANRDYYASSVESRVLIEALINRLKMPPYRLEPGALQELGAYDNNLHRGWKPGEFVWPEEWQPAYPEPTYWWLYGRPR